VLKDKGMRTCILGPKPRVKAVCYDKRRYCCRNRTEIMFGRAKDRSRVANPYDRRKQLNFSAIVIAATPMSWLSRAKAT
jgi:hypothetical protein